MSATHAELQRRAEQAGMSLQAYVRQLLEEATAGPTLADWPQCLDDLPGHVGVSGADDVRDARTELP